MSKKKSFFDNNLYADSQPHLMFTAVDCIIFGFDGDDLKLLIMKRKMEPLRGEWSLIGSIIRLEETVEEAATRILNEATGLSDLYLEQSKVYSEVDRDLGYRCMSVAMYTLIRSDKFHLVSEQNQYDSHWHGLEDLPNLVLDHKRMVLDAMVKLRSKVKYHPIGFELLPEKFTIPQLQKLYEVILDEELDSRNFRKKMLSLGILQQLSEKDKSGSKKGAYLYQFNHEAYHKLVSSGFNFGV
ncbi:NUDIX hydrolase [Namhaeicola litoreus]|uniref:NUDIX domain-containing protein n=1 Tax=Namhaeicola litoreus TaxID=1052145 RepID=A0ABW3Y537_9FLAO